MKMTAGRPTRTLYQRRARYFSVEEGFNIARPDARACAFGPLTQKLYDTIVGIQYGTTPDARGWTVEV